MWSNEAAFGLHVTLPHTEAFLARAVAWCDRPPEISRLSLKV